MWRKGHGGIRGRKRRGFTWRIWLKFLNAVLGFALRLPDEKDCSC